MHQKLVRGSAYCTWQTNRCRLRDLKLLSHTCSMSNRAVRASPRKWRMIEESHGTWWISGSVDAPRLKVHATHSMLHCIIVLLARTREAGSNRGRCRANRLQRLRRCSLLPRRSPTQKSAFRSGTAEAGSNHGRSVSRESPGKVKKIQVRKILRAQPFPQVRRLGSRPCRLFSLVESQVADKYSSMDK